MDLCNFFLDCAKVERTIELSRQNLSQIPSFHPYQSFKEIDVHNQGYVTAQSMQLFLHRFGYLYTLKECSVIFYKTEFKYVDFLRFLLPTNQLLRDFISLQEQKVGQSMNCLEEMAKHISLELTLMNSLIPPKSIDKLMEGTKEEIEYIFKKHRMFVYQDEIDSIIRRLDFYGDDKIDLLLLKNWIKILNKTNIPQQEREYHSAFVTPKKGVVIINQTKSTEKSNKMHCSTLREQLGKQPTGKMKPTSNNNYLLEKSKLRGQIALKKELQETEKKETRGSTGTIKKSMNQTKTKRKSSGEILEYLIDREIKIEKIKQQLALQQDFNCLDAFRVLDLYDRGCLGIEEFSIFLNQQIDKNSQLFSKCENSCLKYADFVRLLQPYSVTCAEMLNNKQASSKIYLKKMNEVFYPQTIKLMKEYFGLLQQIPVKLEGNIQLFNKIDGITRDNFIGVSDV